MPLVFVTPAPNTHFPIDAGTAATGPTMPAITAEVRLNGVPVPPGAVVNYRWTAQLRYPGSLAPPAGLDDVHRVNEDMAFAGPDPQWTFTFANVRGGQLTISCQAVIPGGPPVPPVTVTGLLIEGVNPPPDHIRAALTAKAAEVGLPASTHDVLRKICAQESNNGRQFAAPNPGQSVNPYLNLVPGDGGVGLMQLTPAQNADQVWNWRENVRRGVDLFNSFYGLVDTYITNFRKSDALKDKVKQYNLARQAAGLATVVVDVPDFTAEQKLNDAIRGLNGWSGKDEINGGAPDKQHLHEYHIVDATGQLLLDSPPGTPLPALPAASPAPVAAVATSAGGLALAPSTPATPGAPAGGAPGAAAAVAAPVGGPAPTPAAAAIGSGPAVTPSASATPINATARWTQITADDRRRIWREQNPDAPGKPGPACPGDPDYVTHVNNHAPI